QRSPIREKMEWPPPFVASLVGTCLTLVGILVAIYGLRTWRNTLENQRTDGGLEQYPLLAERVGCSACTKVSPRSGAVLTLGRRLRGRLHDATQTTPVSALKRAQAPSARAEPADGCCSRGSSSRS